MAERLPVAWELEGRVRTALEQAPLNRGSGPQAPGAFELLAGDPRSSVVIHVPHAATAIPQAARQGILLDDDALRIELLRMTDAHTDAIAVAAQERAAVRPWIFRNRLSRLVVDPERFPDEREEMEAVGMGAVYTMTHDLKPLRAPAVPDLESLLDTYFHPYARAFAMVAAERLETRGRVLIIDLHSYSSHPLAYELHAAGERPELCLGTDDFHTPSTLVTAARRMFERIGKVGLNSPFAGTYVPLEHYRVERRVEALMLEIRRDVYLDESTGVLLPGRVEELGGALASLIDQSS